MNRNRPERWVSHRGDLLSAAAIGVMVLCCVAPAAFGALAGSIGGWLGIAVACLVAIGSLLLVRRRRRDC